MAKGFFKFESKKNKAKTASNEKKYINVCIFCKEPDGREVQPDHMKLNLSQKEKIGVGIDENTELVMNDTRPCDCCKDRVGEGFAVLEVADTPIYGENHEPILKPRNGRPGAYLTGEHMVLPDSDVARKLFPHIEIRDDQQTLLVPTGMVEPILTQIRKNLQK